MADAALIGIAQSVLLQLSSPPLEEILLVWNFKKDLERLRNSIQAIADFLHDAERREFKEHLVKGWLSRLRAVLYDADDLLDSVSVRASRKEAMTGNALKKEVCLFFSKSNQLFFAMKIAHDVKGIKEHIDDIAKDMSQFNFISKRIDQDIPIRASNRDETHSFVKLEDVIGRDQEREEIVKLLLPIEETRQQNLSVIAITGFGGWGKTTLAQFVYNDERVQRGFDLCLWACVNYFSDLKQVLMTILASVHKSKPQDKNLEQLQIEFRKTIEGKKYLLVLDDVCDEQTSNWRELKPFLECGKNGSKVLATTRNREVARCLGAIQPYYRLSGLSKESAWSLFVKTTFEEGELDNHELERLGRQIVEKCGYVPLALITIGSMLRYKEREKKRRLSIVDKELPEVLSQNNGDNKIISVLMISYNDLPPALKHCFAYCSVFPKDYTFNKDKLVRMWLAQGFLEPHADKSLEEVGDDYFFYLVDRGFFQEVNMYARGGCLTCVCTMHDLLRDLAMQVAGMESKCFVETDLKGMAGKNTLRHVSVNCKPSCLFDKLGASSQSKTLKTLLFHDKKQLKTNSLNSKLASFRLLHTLELPDLEVVKLPNSIGDLSHLRYLDLSFNWDLEILPNSICKLHHLQTLILVDCRSLKELPSNFRALVRLRHLLLKGCNRLASLPSGLTHLSSLVTLDRVFVHRHIGGLRYLGGLDNLGGSMNVELPINGWSNFIEDAREANLSMKQRLQGMTVKWIKPNLNGAREMVKEATRGVLEALQPNNNLQYLKIERQLADSLPSWVFSLSKLKELILTSCTLEYLHDEVRPHDSFLARLEILEIYSSPNLKGWWRDTTSIEKARRSELPCLPRVSKVVIKDCPKLVGSMPFFSEIENLEIMRENWKLVSKLLNSRNADCPSSSSSSSECQHLHSNKLRALSLFDVTDLSCLPEPSLRYLTALKSLKIELSFQLNWVSCSGLAYLTALESLEIFNCGNVTLVNRDDGNVENGAGMPWRALQRLRYLDVPWQSHLQGGLQYLTALVELKICYFQNRQVEEDNEYMEGRRFLLTGPERLQTLTIKAVHNDVTCCFPKWIQHLRSLKHLNFYHCEELSVSWTILANMNLVELSFDGVEKVVIVDDTMPKQASQSNSLVQLRIEYIEEGNWLHDVPWQLFPSLRILDLDSIRNLSSLPDGIQRLTSLQILEIDDCKSIKAIPGWMINLTSLQQLSITSCSRELADRCIRETGVDWRLISHIRSIQIMHTLDDSDDDGDDDDIRIIYTRVRD